MSSLRQMLDERIGILAATVGVEVELPQVGDDRFDVERKYQRALESVTAAVVQNGDRCVCGALEDREGE